MSKVSCCSGVTAMGRPGYRPRARAASRPARVRSRMRSRSRCASAPRIVTRENTLYPGRNFVEVYIVKDGQVRAMDRHGVPIE